MRMVLWLGLSSLATSNGTRRVGIVASFQLLPSHFVRHSSSNNIPSAQKRASRKDKSHSNNQASSPSQDTDTHQHHPRHGDTVTTELVDLVRNHFQSVADPKRAIAMKKYLKTDMPMYGVPRPMRFEVEKNVRAFLATHYPNAEQVMTLDVYLEIVETLWNLPMREEKYLAIDLAIYFHKSLATSATTTATTPTSTPTPPAVAALPLYESMLRQEYMWWDLVDPIATYLIGNAASSTILQRWIRDDNVWIRRSALLAQLKFKHRTDEALLFQFCQICAPEKEFFIRKAIGWALREYSKTSPEAVKTFLLQEKSNLSGLSYREGGKILMRQGLL